MKTMLVVDDSAFMRKLIIKSVAELDVTVVAEAENGKIAVEKYVELEPDIVTLDIAMLEHNGIEALKKIKEHNPDATVIIISSTTDQDIIADDVMALGAHSIITKPNFKDELIEAISGL